MQFLRFSGNFRKFQLIWLFLLFFRTKFENVSVSTNLITADQFPCGTRRFSRHCIFGADKYS